MSFMQPLVDWLLQTIGTTGYVGIAGYMAIESSFIPLPSEAILIPAGILIQRGELSFLWVLIASIIGSVIGASINYLLAYTLGRKVIEALVEKYGSFLLLSRESIQKTEIYFSKYGGITTFTGRLIPVVRHLISLPAGFGKMNYPSFVLWTALGAGIWSAILLSLGLVVGQQYALLQQYIDQITLVVIIGALSIWFIYSKNKR